MNQKSREEVASFYDEFSNRQQRDFVYGNARVTAAIERVMQYVDDSTRAILDVGCGCGQLAWEYGRDRPQIEVTGLDISPRNIEVARTLFDLPNLHYGVSDLSDAPAGKFDVIALIDVYEHIPKDTWPTFNQTLASCLAPGGTLVLTTPTPMKQRYLMEHAPEELQVIDEIVEREDLFRLADDLGAEPIVWEYVAIWEKYDYTHFVASRELGAIEKKPPTQQSRSFLTRVTERLEKSRSVRQRKQLVREKLGIAVD